MAQQPDGGASSKRIQLYSLATPNGQKVAIALEEMGLQYDAHAINILKGEQFAPDFLKVSPNNKIPAIVDPEGPSGNAPLALFESGAILLYLAEKTGKLLPKDPAARYETISWLFWQVGGVGPMFGQLGYFKQYAPEPKIQAAIDRYATEAKRLLGVLDKRLSGEPVAEGLPAAAPRLFVAGDEFTIADAATMPWVVSLSKFYHADELLGLAGYKAVNAWVERCLARPATKRGMEVTPFPKPAAAADAPK